MSLYPLAGSVDIMVASELIEAGRAMQNGFVTPNCTTLIASTHRVYAMAERTADCMVPRCSGVPTSLWATTTTSPTTIGPEL